MEFCNPETFQIVLLHSDGTCQSFLLKDLFPMSFGPKNLG